VVVQAAKRSLARQKFVEHDAEREEVGAPVEALARGLLGGHVGDLALHEVALRLVEPRGAARDAEVRELHLAHVADHDVVRGDVAVHDLEPLTLVVALGVGVLQPLEHLDDEVERHVHRHLAPAPTHLAEEPRGVDAVDPLHAGPEVAVGDAEVVDADDVAVPQLRGGARLVDEHLHEGLVVVERRADALDADLAAEVHRADLLGREDLCHAALRDALDEDVVAEAVASVHGTQTTRTRGDRARPARAGTSTRVNPPLPRAIRVTAGLHRGEKRSAYGL
jgi:hypothetical protein